MEYVKLIRDVQCTGNIVIEAGTIHRVNRVYNDCVEISWTGRSIPLYSVEYEFCDYHTPPVVMEYIDW